MTILVAALINGFVASALTTVSLWLLLRLVPRRTLNAATRYWVWWAAMAIAIIVPLCFIHIPVNDSVNASLPEFPSTPPPVSFLQPSVAPSHASPQLPAATRGRSSPRFRIPAFPVELRSTDWARWVIIAWSVAALLLVLRLAVSFRLLYRIQSRTLQIPGTLAPRIQQWVADHNSRRAVALKSSREIGTPVAVGPLCPSVLIPEGLLSKLDAAELVQVGLHEAAHFVRRDDYALLVQRLIEALFALHPVIHWIGRQLELEREMACDDLVIASTGCPKSYAECLVRIVELSGGSRSSVVAVAAAEDGSHLARRIDVLFDKTRHTGTQLLKLRLIALIGAAAALAFAAGRVSDIVAFSRPVAQRLPLSPSPSIVKVTLLPLQAAEAAATPQGIAGRVLEDSSGSPLASAELRFHKAGMYELAADLETDRQGRFTAPDLPAGDYTIDASKANYITTTFKLHVPSGSPLIRLVRYGVIDGQAMDAQGKPLPGRVLEPTGRTHGSTRITILTKRPGTEELQLFREMPLEDGGHYRIFDLPPGEYAVGIWYSGINDGSGMQLYPDNASPRFFGVTGGEEYNNINFVVAPRPAWSVSGRLTLPEGVKGQFQLALGLPDQPLLPLSQTMSEPDGSFRFEKIPAGTYDLFAAGPTSGYTAYESVLGRGEPLFGRSRITVSAQDLEGLAVAMTAGQSFKVRLRAAGESNGEHLPQGCGAKAEISIASVEPWGVLFTNRTVVDFGKDQTVGNVAPGRFRIFANDLGASCYQVTRPIVDLTSGAADPAVIEIASAGSIQGSIKNGNGALAVVLLPAASVSGTEARVAFPGADGQFVFESLAPGRYRIEARPASEGRARWVSQRGGRQVDVLAGTPTTVELDAGGRP